MADNRLGWHGGGEALRWVRSPRDADVALRDLAVQADRVRVMPFLEGIPCSIHGFVLPDHVAVLRPCELIVLRRPGEPTLRYASAATLWEPPPADRAEMRAVARRVGELLRRRVSYRGAFTVDGVLTVEGFRPTELNPRFGAALAMLARGADLPLLLLNLAVVEGLDVGLDGRAFEREVLEAADAHPAGGGLTVVDRRLEPRDPVPLRWTGDRFEVAERQSDADATLVLGPGPTGGAVRLVLDPARHPAGPSVAPKVVAAFALADERFDTGIGPLEPAPDVRAG